jgi:hypothetical protein
MVSEGGQLAPSGRETTTGRPPSGEDHIGKREQIRRPFQQLVAEPARGSRAQVLETVPAMQADVTRAVEQRPAGEQVAEAMKVNRAPSPVVRAAERFEHPGVGWGSGEALGGAVQAAFQAEVGALLGAGLDVAAVDAQRWRAEEALAVRGGVIGHLDQLDGV